MTNKKAEVIDRMSSQGDDYLNMEQVPPKIITVRAPKEPMKKRENGLFPQQVVGSLATIPN